MTLIHITPEVIATAKGAITGLSNVYAASLAGSSYRVGADDWLTQTRREIADEIHSYLIDREGEVEELDYWAVAGDLADTGLVDGLLPVYTWELWDVFTALALYHEEIGADLTGRTMTDAAAYALTRFAERMVYELVQYAIDEVTGAFPEHIEDEDEDEDE